MSIIFYCNDPLKKRCHWSGDEGELVCTGADPKHFTHCPHCGGEDFTEEEEEEDEEEDE